MHISKTKPTNTTSTISLRSRTNEEGNKMDRMESRGDGVLAQDFSIQEKEHPGKMEELNSEASDCVFCR